MVLNGYVLYKIESGRVGRKKNLYENYDKFLKIIFVIIILKNLGAE